MLTAVLRNQPSRLATYTLSPLGSRIPVRRSFHRSIVRDSIKDPSHPYLHYHPSSTLGQTASKANRGTALSFLATPPTEGSRTVLGWLGDGATLADFKDEPEFLKLLHDSIREGLELGKAETVLYEAASRPSDGYIHITDERAIPPAGRIGETEDLIGSVFVQDGKLKPETYSPFPTYRLVTSNGPLILPRGLAEHFLETLERIDAEEKKRASEGEVSS